MKRYLFLDVDGVLNHRAWHLAQKDVPYEAARHFDRQIDPACVARLVRLVEVLDADVVLSSTWRGIHKAEAALSRAGVPNWVDITPSLSGKPRGHEIQAWMTAKGVEPQQIVILDDDSDMAHLDHRLVQTNHARGGLEDDHVQRALRLFGIK